MTCITLKVKIVGTTFFQKASCAGTERDKLHSRERFGVTAKFLPTQVNTDLCFQVLQEHSESESLKDMHIHFSPRNISTHKASKTINSQRLKKINRHTRKQHSGGTSGHHRRYNQTHGNFGEKNSQSAKINDRWDWEIIKSYSQQGIFLIFKKNCQE